MSIQHVSDTALWVAMYRAIETERPDACFRDPYARRLAGERGAELLDRIPKARRWGWPMVTRTAILDEVIGRSVREEGTDLVVNLAAGLDTRPYRLDLPASLTWVEVDLPAILAYKAERLQGETPRCRFEPVAIDLAVESARRSLFDRLAARGGRTLVVAEGLLVYLDPADVAGLAGDLRAVTAVRGWLFDLAGPRVLRFMQRSWGRSFDASVRFRFAPAEGTAFFAPYGWRESWFRPLGEEAARLGRAPSWWALSRFLQLLVPPARREQLRRMSGVVRLEPAGG